MKKIGWGQNVKQKLQKFILGVLIEEAMVPQPPAKVERVKPSEISSSNTILVFMQTENKLWKKNSEFNLNILYYT